MNDLAVGDGGVADAGAVDPAAAVAGGVVLNCAVADRGAAAVGTGDPAAIAIILICMAGGVV